MKRKTIVAALLACLLLSSCGGGEAEGSYKVALYNGGVVVREWSDVSSYTRWSDQFIEIRVDGESFYISGGLVTIERDKGHI